MVGPDNKAHVQAVKMGRRIDHDWIVDEGLHPDDRIVVEGVQKVHEGAPVSPKPWTPPAAASPTPTATAGIR